MKKEQHTVSNPILSHKEAVALVEDFTPAMWTVIDRFASIPNHPDPELRWSYLKSIEAFRDRPALLQTMFEMADMLPYLLPHPEMQNAALRAYTVKVELERLLVNRIRRRAGKVIRTQWPS